MTYFLDTNVCICHLNNTSANISGILARTQSTNISIPSMVAAELVYGAEKSVKREHNLKKVKSFLSLYDMAPFNGKAAEIYGVIRVELERKGMIIGANDLVIAATVLAYDGTLVTHNVNEFSRVKGLIINDWA